MENSRITRTPLLLGLNLLGMIIVAFCPICIFSMFFGTMSFGLGMMTSNSLAIVVGFLVCFMIPFFWRGYHWFKNKRYVKFRIRSFVTLQLLLGAVLFLGGLISGNMFLLIAGYIVCFLMPTLYKLRLKGHKRIAVFVLFMLVLFALFGRMVQYSLSSKKEECNLCVSTNTVSTNEDFVSLEGLKNKEFGDSLLSNVDMILDSGQHAFLYFYADWCHFCKAEKPIIESLEAQYEGQVVFLWINERSNQEAMKEFGVNSFPSMFLISDKDRDNYVSKSIRGFKTEDELTTTIDDAIAEGNLSQDELSSSYDVVPSMVTFSAFVACVVVSPVFWKGRKNLLKKSNLPIFLIFMLLVFPLNDRLSESNMRARATTVPSVAGTQSNGVNCSDTITTDTTLTEDLLNCPGDGLIIGADNITLDCAGHTIDGVNSGSGVYASGKSGVTIKNCNVIEFGYAIYLSTSSNNTIINSTANGYYYGIILGSSPNNTIMNSNTSGLYSGIHLGASSNNTIINSAADSIWSISGGTYIAAIRVSGSGSYDNKIIGSFARALGKGIYAANGIQFDTSATNNQITNSTAIGSYNGIHLLSSSNNTIINATSQGIRNPSQTRFEGPGGGGDIRGVSSAQGIRLESSSNNNEIINSIASGTGTSNGIQLIQVSNNTLSNVNATGNMYDFYSEGNSRNTANNLMLATANISFEALDTWFHKTAVKPADTFDLHNISKYVDAGNTSTGSWALLNVSYADEDVADVDETSLKWYRWNGTDWDNMGISPNGVNTAENYVYGNITQFSTFAPMAEPFVYSVAVIDVIPVCKYVFTTCLSHDISVTVLNNGTGPANISVSVYYNESGWHEIGNQTVTDLAPDVQTDVTISWDLGGLQENTNYTIKANATLLNGIDINPDNNEAYSWVKVNFWGDVNDDGVINILDLKLVKLAYSDLIDEPMADLDCNGVINILDVKIVKLIYSGLLP